MIHSQVAEPTIGSTAVSAGNELPSSRELERLNEELRQLNGEKLKLEEEVNREEATIKLKQSEIKSMQNETETLHQMVRQLDVQKGEARKRLDDLTSQVCSSFVMCPIDFRAFNSAHTHFYTVII